MRRKDFLGTMLLAPAALAAVQGAKQLGPTVFDPSRRHTGDFSPTGGLRTLSPNLYLYEDCANVYIVKQGTRAALINFGSGDVLKMLPRLGIERVDLVLITHHHRTMAQGLVDIEDYPFEVRVPRSEAHYFEHADQFWRDAKIFINYDLKSTWNTPRRNVKISGTVAGGETVSWGEIPFRVLDTPGITDGAVSYCATIDGRRVAFTGDLIAGAGKVNNWFDLHWAYYGFTQGIDASEKSFERIRSEAPAWLLPAHGEPMNDAEAAMRANTRIHGVLREMLPPNSSGRKQGAMRHILPHLVHVGGPSTLGTGFMTTYAILTDSGKALFYDYGYADFEHTQKIKKELGIKHIVLTFSHYHDDHLIRAYELRRAGGDVEIWVLDKMADVLTHPERYRLPCLVPFPIRPDRVVRDGERIKWEGYNLHFFHQPGQTDYHQGLNTIIDGKKVMFTGDNTWNKGDVSRVRNGPLVPQNEYFLDSGFITCASQMLEFGPDIVCPAHTEEYSPTHEDLEGFLGWAHRLRDVMSDYIAQPDPNFGMDYRWTHFYPALARPGQGEFEVQLRVRNHLFKPGTLRVQLKHGPELLCAEPVQTCTVDAKTEAAIPFRLRRRPGSSGRTVAMADLTFNGRRLGEAAELIVE
ncbi:MAG: MBL fold metallo-hydrolase [Bryobacterales bacterium]|nr:MBL fold metallo-hydrolase [Bryobacterales bacterium]